MTLTWIGGEVQKNISPVFKIYWWNHWNRMQTRNKRDRERLLETGFTDTEVLLETFRALCPKAIF